MGVTTGIAIRNNYAGAATDKDRVQLLLDLIPNPDAPHGSGAIQKNTGGGNLDEMSPAAAAELRVELLALKNAVT